MNDCTTYTNDLQRFVANASDALLRRGRLVPLLEKLGLHVNSYSGGYRAGPCPICQADNLFIGLTGKIFSIYWKCYNASCPSNTGEKRFVKNIVGLVRALSSDKTMPAAMKVIANWLGTKNPYEVTNNKLEDTHPPINLPASPLARLAREMGVKLDPKPASDSPWDEDAPR